MVLDSDFNPSLPYETYLFVDVTFFTEEGPSITFWESTVLYLPLAALTDDPCFV